MIKLKTKENVTSLLCEICLYVLTQCKQTGGQHVSAQQEQLHYLTENP